MAFDQGFAHGVQHRFDGKFSVTVSQLLKARSQSFNEVGAGHLEKRFCKRQRKSLWLSPERAKLEALIFSRSFR
jgi:hypothetical protein